MIHGHKVGTYRETSRRVVLMEGGHRVTRYSTCMGKAQVQNKRAALFSFFSFVHIFIAGAGELKAL